MGERNGHIIRVDEAACVGCGLCVGDCPAGNLALAGGKAAVKAQHCILCGHCVAICPKAAVSISGFAQPPEEIDGAVRLNPEELMRALKTRRSIRRFTNRPVAPEVRERILQAGRYTPTAKNAQAVSYLVLEEKRTVYETIAVRFFRKMLPVAGFVYPAAKQVDIDANFFFKKAPLAIVVLAKNEVDGGLAAANMALMAEASGLGVLYSGFFTMAVNHCGMLRRALQLKKEKAVTTLVLGEPDVRYHRVPQREEAQRRYL